MKDTLYSKLTEDKATKIEAVMGIIFKCWKVEFQFELYLVREVFLVHANRPPANLG